MGTCHFSPSRMYCLMYSAGGNLLPSARRNPLSPMLPVGGIRVHAPAMPHVSCRRARVGCPVYGPKPMARTPILGIPKTRYLAHPCHGLVWAPLIKFPRSQHSQSGYPPLSVWVSTLFQSGYPPLTKKFAQFVTLVFAFSSILIPFSCSFCCLWVIF